MSNINLKMYSAKRLILNSNKEQNGRVFYSTFITGGKLLRGKINSNSRKNVFLGAGETKRCLATAAPSKWAGHVSDDFVLSSPHGNVRMPNQTITDFIFEHHKKFADKPAITCGTTGRSYSYGTCHLMIDKFAKALLKEVQLEPKEVIAIVLPNIPEFVPAVNGAHQAGLQVTFANPLYTEEELLRQFQDCDVKAIITIDHFMEKCLAVSKKLKNFKGTILVGQEELKKENVYGLKPLIMGDFKALLPYVEVDDVALIPYSSGTTGIPKGVMLTHKNLVVNLMQAVTPTFFRPNEGYAALYPMPEGEGSENYDRKPDGTLCLPSNHDTVLTVPPFFHIYGYNGILNYNLRLGSHVVSIPKFTPEEYLASLKKYKPKALFVVPSLLTFLGTHPVVTREDLSSTKHIVVGAAPTTDSIVEKFLQKCGKSRAEIVIQQGFGMTESSPIATLSPLISPHSKVVSAGQLVPGTQGRIVSLTDGKNMGSNLTGELYIKGPQVMKGYLNNPEATIQTVDKDGWLHTGDVAYYDDDHFFYIVDRTKELIKVKGNQVSPTELESVIMEMSSVTDAAVVAVPDELAGELPKAFVVLNKDAKTSKDDIYDWVKGKVVKYKRLDGGVVFVDVIPRNPAGKILRNELKLLGNKRSS